MARSWGWGRCIRNVGIGHPGRPKAGPLPVHAVSTGKDSGLISRRDSASTRVCSRDTSSDLGRIGGSMPPDTAAPSRLGRSPTMSLPRPNGSAAITDCNDVSKGRPGVFARLPSRRSAGAGARIGRERARKVEKCRNPLATNDGLKSLRRKEFSRNSLTPLDRDMSLKRTVNPFVGSSSLPPGAKR